MRAHPASRWLAVASLLALLATLLPAPPPVGRSIEGAEPAPPTEAVAPTESPPATPAASADAPPKPKRPPRHKPGQRSASYNPYMRDPAALARAKAAGYPGPKAPPIEQLLADGTMTDPLAGNYTILLRQQAIALDDTTATGGTVGFGYDYNLDQEGGPGSVSNGNRNGLWPTALSGVAADVNA